VFKSVFRSSVEVAKDDALATVVVAERMKSSWAIFGNMFGGITARS
jgi:hypothetical protein